MTDFNNIDLGNKSSCLIRTKSRFFNIYGCSVLTDGVIADRDGLVPNAIEVSDEEVSELVAEADERNQQLERIQILLEQWIEVRRARSRRAKQRLQQLQKQEVLK